MLSTEDGPAKGFWVAGAGAGSSGPFRFMGADAYDLRHSGHGAKRTVAFTFEEHRLLGPSYYMIGASTWPGRVYWRIRENLVESPWLNYGLYLKSYWGSLCNLRYILVQAILGFLASYGVSSQLDSWSLQGRCCTTVDARNPVT